MTPTEILTISNFLQNHINSAEPTYQGSTFGEWQITDADCFIDAVCYLINANITRYFSLAEDQSEYFGALCSQSYATGVIVELDTLSIERLEADGEITAIAVPIKALEKQLS